MAGSNTDDNPFKVLCSLLQTDEIITPNSLNYNQYSQTWASQKHLNPGLVIRPTSTDSLSKALTYLYTTSLDFVIYGQGFSSASAKDVLIDTSAFDGFHFDVLSELVTIGAGQTWAEVYRKLDEIAPEYGITGARTSCVGVAGTIVSGGFSWLSSEYGCISDPKNMIDAKVVKYDGSVAWASAEPELLWTLRGGGGGFGVHVEVKLRVFPYPQNIWAGQILVPRESLQQVAAGIARFVAQPVSPKITVFLYVMRGKLLASIGANSDMLVIHAFDAHGEEHGRANFRWALNIPGAIDQTIITNIAGVAKLQDQADIVKGTMKQFWQPLLLREITEEIIVNAIEWSEGIKDIDVSLGDCTYLIFELLSSRDPVGGSSSCAWPRPSGTKHILLLGTGCPSDAEPSQENMARNLAIQAPTKVLGNKGGYHVLPNGMEDYHDPEKIWGPHIMKLRDLRSQFDPRERFKGAVNVKRKST